MGASVHERKCVLGEAAVLFKPPPKARQNPLTSSADVQTIVRHQSKFTRK